MKSNQPPKITFIETSSLSVNEVRLERDKLLKEVIDFYRVWKLEVEDKEYHLEEIKAYTNEI